MHELSVVQSVVEMVEREAKSNHAIGVSRVCLEIGDLAGIEMDALKFAWKSVIPHTLLRRSKLVIDKVKGKARCENCGKEFEMHDYFDVCPECQSFQNEVLAGKELKVKSIEIEY